MNKLKLNKDKYKNYGNKYILITTQIQINNKITQKVEKFKTLGFIIDEDMNFKDHIDYICQKNC